MHGPGPKFNLCVWPALPLVGYLDKWTRWKLSERQRRAVGESWWGPWSVHHSWSSWGKGSWRYSDWGSRSLPGLHPGESFSGGTCIWCQGSPGLLQTRTPRQRAAASPVPYWFSVHLPRWCQWTRDCQALCTRHRDWGWSPDAVSPRTQRREGQWVCEKETTPNKKTEEAGTPGEFNPHIIPQILGWWCFSSSLMNPFINPDEIWVNNAWFSSQIQFFICISQCWS